MTTETTEVSEPAKRPLLSEDSKMRYMKALTFLIGELSLNDWLALNVDTFCKDFELKPSFIEALRDLECLIYNPVLDNYKKTGELYKITPEQVLKQMRANGPKSTKNEVVITHPKTREGIHNAAQMYREMEVRGEKVVGLTESGADLIKAILKADEEFQSNTEIIASGPITLANELIPQRPKKTEILSKELHQMQVDQNRRDQIMDVINTRAKEGLTIPIEWIEEYNEIIERRVITRI